MTREPINFKGNSYEEVHEKLKHVVDDAVPNDEWINAFIDWLNNTEHFNEENEEDFLKWACRSICWCDISKREELKRALDENYARFVDEIPDYAHRKPKFEELKNVLDLIPESIDL